jgi:hypothetical protein
MQAHDRTLPQWFDRIRSRQITLPRFQRFVAWGHGEVADLLTTVLRGLPAGASLILEVGDEEKFQSRSMTDAPEKGERVVEQLLDGQQRLTALWRSLHDKYLDRSYLIGFTVADDNPAIKLPFVYGQARWHKNNARYPIWVDKPDDCWGREMIPVRLLRPGDIQAEIESWIEAAIVAHTGDKFPAYKSLSNQINELRTKVREFNLPYLALPTTTSKEVALDVFIKMNTSSVRLSTYDIVVALVEDETGQSLHDHVEQLATAVPRAKDYCDLAGLVLDVVALSQDRVPSQAGYKGINYKTMLSEWPLIVSNIKGMVELLEEESCFDGQRLPTYPAIPVVAALMGYLPSNPDKLGNARLALRQYLWRAFLTSRYEQSSASNSLQDYRAMKKVLEGEAACASVPIFDEAIYPIPTSEIVLQQDWPKNRTIVGRGLLCLQLKAGALDLADGKSASVNSIRSQDHPREYHHLFPAALLKAAGMSEERTYLAMNCALITWRTNRSISDKDPVQYLKERADSCSLGEPELISRLKSHLIPFDMLAKGPYDAKAVDFNERVSTDYMNFLEKRAQCLSSAAKMACNGQSSNLISVMG